MERSEPSGRRPCVFGDGQAAPASETPSDGQAAPASETPSDGQAAPASETPSDGHAALRADARRNQRSILQAAARLLADEPSASMQAIADLAGLSRPTVYRRFQTRDELIEAIRLEAFAEVLEHLEAAAASSEPAGDALERLIRELAGVVARYPLLLELFRADQADTAAVRRKGAPPQVAFAFDALITRGQLDGTLRADLRADVLSQVTLGGLRLALKLGHQSGRNSDDVGGEVASIILGGVRA